MDLCGIAHNAFVLRRGLPRPSEAARTTCYAITEIEMIYEPQIECICDKCGTDETVTPEYKYRDYSGNNGYYACEDDDVIAQLDGWVITDDGKTLCDECA